jgi:NHL repeat
MSQPVSLRPRIVAVACILSAAFGSFPGGVPAGALAIGSAALLSLNCGPRSLPGDPSQWQWAWSWELATPVPNGPIVSGVPGGGRGGPFDISLDASCNLYVADAGNNVIVEYSQDGDGNLSQVNQWSPSLPNGSFVRGVAVGPSGAAYLSPHSNIVAQLLPSPQMSWGNCQGSQGNACKDPLPAAVPGGNLAAWHCSTDCPQGNLVFSQTDDLIADGQGNIFVLDNTGDRVLKLSSAGKLLSAFGGSGTGPGQFSLPDAITLDQAGNIYVADWSGNATPVGRVQKFSPDGQFLAAWAQANDGTQLIHPQGLAVDLAGDIYVAANDWYVYELSPSGDLVATWPDCKNSGDPNCGLGISQDTGQFLEPRGLAVDGQGDLYVADMGNNRIQRFYAQPVQVPSDNQSDGTP